jgi:hypothetical protein
MNLQMNWRFTWGRWMSGPNKENRAAGLGRPALDLPCLLSLDSSPTCSFLHYVFVFSCFMRIHRPNTLDHSFVFEWWDQCLPPLLCVTSYLPWFTCFHLFPTKQSHVALPHASLLNVPKMFWW